MWLNKSGKNYLSQKLNKILSAQGIENLNQKIEIWAHECALLKAETVPGEQCVLHLRANETESGNTHMISLPDDLFCFGTLTRLSDATAIREATFSERYESDKAAEHDNSVGAFKAEIDGQMVTVYVDP